MQELFRQYGRLITAGLAFVSMLSLLTGLPADIGKLTEIRLYSQVSEENSSEKAGSAFDTCMEEEAALACTAKSRVWCGETYTAGDLIDISGTGENTISETKASLRIENAWRCKTGEEKEDEESPSLDCSAQTIAFPEPGMYELLISCSINGKQHYSIISILANQNYRKH